MVLLWLLLLDWWRWPDAVLFIGRHSTICLFTFQIYENEKELQAPEPIVSCFGGVDVVYFVSQSNSIYSYSPGLVPLTKVITVDSSMTILKIEQEHKFVKIQTASEEE